MDATACVGRWSIGLVMGVAACAPRRAPLRIPAPMPAVPAPSGSARAAQQPAPQPAAQKPAAPPPAPRVVSCAAIRDIRNIEQCVHELTPDEAGRRHVSYRFEFDGQRLRTVTRVNGLGQPLPRESGCARRTFEQDPSGAGVRSSSCTDPSGAVRERKRFLDRRVEWLDGWGQPLHPGGVFGELWTFDAQGYIVGYEHLDANGRPTEDEHGIVELRLRANAQGEVIQRSYYDAGGKPMLSKDGYQRVDYEPDGFGGWLSKRYFDSAGKPATDTDGVHLVRRESDAVGNMIGESYFGLHDQPVLGHLGYHAFKVRRDAHGEALEFDLFDVSGKPVDGIGHYAIQKRSYDKLERPVEWTYFHADGSPATAWGDYHEKLVELDADGHPVVEHFLGVHQQPVLLKEGYATKETSYDERGNRIEESFFGTYHEPVVDRNGVHGTEWQRNATDQVKAITTSDTRDVPVDARDGFARVMISYGPDGRELRRDYFDQSGAPVDVGTYWLVSVKPAKGHASATLTSLRKVKKALAAGKDLDHAARAAGLKASRWLVAPKALIKKARTLEPGATSSIIHDHGRLVLIHRDR